MLNSVVANPLLRYGVAYVEWRHVATLYSRFHIGECRSLSVVVVPLLDDFSTCDVPIFTLHNDFYTYLFRSGLWGSAMEI